MKRLVFLLALGGLLLAGAPALRAADAAKDKEKEGTVAGTAIARATGFLGLELRDGCFQITFYDAKKHPVPADKTSAVLWWPVHYQPNAERTELVPTDNPAVLASSYHVKPPYAFKLHLSLLSADSEVESYVIDFRN